MPLKFNPLTGKFDLVNTPSGTDGAVQYNNGGSFGGFGLFDDTTNLLTLPGNLSVSTNVVIAHALRSDATDGVQIQASNSTTVAVFGAANTNNSLFYGGVNINGALNGYSTSTFAPTTDIAPVVIQSGGTSTSIKTLELKNSSGTGFFYIRKSLLSDANSGSVFDFATSGSSATFRTGFVVNLTAGYTGAEFTGALAFDNPVAGTATYYLSDATIYGYRPGGNRGFGGFARATTTGHNIGGMVLAGGGAINYGLWAASTITKASAINVGVFACAANASGTSPAAIGLYATLYNTNTAPPNMAGIKTALLVDNQSFTDPIAIFRSNGVSFVSVEDTGDFLLGDRTSTTNLGTRYRIPATITTTDATLTTIETIATATDTSYTLTSRITAVTSTGVMVGSYTIDWAVENDGGVVTLRTGPNYQQNYTAGGIGGITLSISGTNMLVRGTGAAATNIRWQSQTIFSAVKY